LPLQSAMPPAGAATAAGRVLEVSGQGEELLFMLFPHLRGLRAWRVEDTGDAVVIRASRRAPQARCPACGSLSSRVHGGYARVVADGAAGGRPVLVVLSVRRFRMRMSAGAKAPRDGAEQVQRADDLVAQPHGQGAGHASRSRRWTRAGRAGRPVAAADLAAEAPRWPRFAAAAEQAGFAAVQVPAAPRPGQPVHQSGHTNRSGSNPQHALQAPIVTDDQTRHRQGWPK